MSSESRIPCSVLTFLPRTLDRFYAGVSEQTFSGTKNFFCYRLGVDGVNLQNRFRAYYRRPPQNVPLSEEDYRQIVLRDRVLRLLPLDRAHRMVDAMYATIDELTDRFPSEYFLGQMVDHYMLDLVVRICRRKEMRLLMFGCGSLPATMTLTAYGEFNKAREPGEDEIERGVKRLLEENRRITYATPFNGYSARTHLKMCAEWWAKCVYFKSLGILTRDSMNFRYLAATIPGVTSQYAPFGYRCSDYFDSNWEKRLQQSEDPPLLFPLGYTPEATTDYWLRDMRFVDYLPFVLSAARQLSRHFLVLIKEHWASLGHRPSAFYRELSSIPNVVLVPPEVYSRRLMAKVDNVLVGSGTPGIEAAIRGKKVATLHRPYYHLDGHYVNLGNAERVAKLPGILSDFEPPPATFESQREVVRRTLEGTLRIRLIPVSQVNSQESIQLASDSLRTYLRSQHGSGGINFRAMDSHLQFGSDESDTPPQRLAKQAA